MSARSATATAFALLLAFPGSGCFSSDSRQAAETGEGEGEGEGEGTHDGGAGGSPDGGAGTGCSPGAAAEGFALGQRAPAMGFMPAQGERIRLDDRCGQVILIEAGSATCGVCASVLPNLEALYEERRAEGLFVLYVLTANRQGELPGPADLQLFQQEHDLPFPVVADDEGWLVFFMEGGMAIPVDILLDREGIVRLKGGSVDRSALASAVTQRLAAD